MDKLKKQLEDIKGALLLMIKLGAIDQSAYKTLNEALDEALQQYSVSGSLPLQTKLEMFYDFLYERGVAKQLGVGIDTIVKHFIDEKLSGNDR